MKHFFAGLGFTVYRSLATRLVVAQGYDIEQSWDMDDPEFFEKCPAFIRKVLGL